MADDWPPVEGYLALSMMDAMVEFTKLRQMLDALKLDVCRGRASAWQGTGVRRQCKKLLNELERVEFALTQEEEKASDLRLVKTGTEGS